MDILSLSGLVALLHELGVHILGHHASHASETVWDITKTFLIKEGKPINHHLQRAARSSFLAAQQTIARECHQALMAESPVQKSLGQLVYLPPHREELKWLDTKVKETATQLGQLRHDKTVADEFVSRDDLESLCTPEGKLAEARIVALKQQLIDEALTDCHSRCYQYKVETELFEQVSDRFMAAIREDSEVSRVFNARWLAQISTLGQEVKIKVQKLEEQMSLLFSIVLKLDGSVENLNNVVLAKILKELQQLTKDSSIKIDRMRDGSVILVLQGSRQGIEQLRTLFKTGQLKELSGNRVLDVGSEWEDEKPAHVNRPINITKLTDWLRDVFSADWLPAEELAPAYARTARMKNTKRIERGTQLQIGKAATVIFLVNVIPSQENLEIDLWFYPTKGTPTLPAGLQITVLDELGNPVEGLNLVVKSNEDAAKLGLKGKPGERFTMRLVLGEESVDKQFEI